MLKIQRIFFFEAFPRELPISKHYWIVRQGKKICVTKTPGLDPKEKFPSVTCQLYNLKILVKNKSHPLHERYRLKQIAACIGKEHAVFQDSLIIRIYSACLNLVIGYSLQSNHAMLREIKKQKISFPAPPAYQPSHNFRQDNPHGQAKEKTSESSENLPPPAPCQPVHHFPLVQVEEETCESTENLPAPPPDQPVHYFFPVQVEEKLPELTENLPAPPQIKVTNPSCLDLLESVKASLTRLKQEILPEDEAECIELLKSIPHQAFVSLIKESEENYCFDEASYPDSALKIIFNASTSKQLYYLISAGFYRTQPPPLSFLLNLIRGIYFCTQRRQQIALTISIIQALHRHEWLKLSLAQLSNFLTPYTHIQCIATFTFLRLYIIVALEHPKFQETFLLLNVFAEAQLPYMVVIFQGIKDHIKPFNRIKIPNAYKEKLVRWSVEQRKKSIQILIKNAYPQTFPQLEPQTASSEQSTEEFLF